MDCPLTTTFMNRYCQDNRYIDRVFAGSGTIRSSSIRRFRSSSSSSSCCSSSSYSIRIEVEVVVVVFECI